MTRQSLSISRFFGEPLRGILHPVEPMIQRLFSFDELWDVYEAARRGTDSAGAVRKLLALLGITYQVDPGDLARIPLCGPVLAVANHPFGLLEGALLAVLLPQIRPDVRILANSLLSAFPELQERCIYVDPFGHKASIPANARALRESLKWLRRGGMVVAFPAGEVSHPEWLSSIPIDPPWNPALGRIAQRAGAAAVPIFFKGSNSLAFHLAGAVHPALRTASLPRELLNKRGRRISIRIGRAVSSGILESLANGKEVMDYLRCRTYLLETTGAAEGRFLGILPLPQPMKRAEPIAVALSEGALASEISRLAPDRKLCESGSLAVYVGRQDEFPAVLREIGRLREIAFRGAGEGTGRPIDLDRFDACYWHLVLWNQSSRQVVGSYRLGPTPDILPRHGIGGLYTSTLFRYHRDLFDQIGPAIELGRSFIRPEYQKQYAPLVLLWKGITRYAASRPECGRLFGAVSISRSYHPASRHLIVKFLEARRADELARFVTPRTPYRPDGRALRRAGVVSLAPDSIDDLSHLVSGIENDGKGVPILVRHYLRAGGRLLGFNVDRRFADALDALIMVDLRVAPASLMERYLGKPEALAFAAARR